MATIHPELFGTIGSCSTAVPRGAGLSGATRLGTPRWGGTCFDNSGIGGWQRSPALVPLGRLPSGPCVLYFVVSNHHYGRWLIRPLEIAPTREITREFHQGFVMSVLVFSTLLLAYLPSAPGVLKRTRPSQSFLCLPLADFNGASGKHRIRCDWGLDIEG